MHISLLQLYLHYLFVRQKSIRQYNMDQSQKRCAIVISISTHEYPKRRQVPVLVVPLDAKYSVS